VWREDNNNNNVRAQKPTRHLLHHPSTFIINQPSATSIDLRPTRSTCFERIMADELFELRNHFYLKNFQAGVNEGSSRPSAPALAIESDSLVYRCFIGMGNNRVVLQHMQHMQHMQMMMMAALLHALLLYVVLIDTFVYNLLLS
jgi:hypothetical protein